MKVDELDFIEMKYALSSKDIVKKMKSHKWERIFTIQISDKRVVSRTYKELYQSPIKDKLSNLNGTKDMTRSSISVMREM